jgi:hypothetical protein
MQGSGCLSIDTVTGLQREAKPNPLSAPKHTMLPRQAETREVYSSFHFNIMSMTTGRLLLRRCRQPAAPDADIHREGFCADTHAEWCDWEYDHMRRSISWRAERGG